MNYITNRESAYPNRINIPIADEDANVTFTLFPEKYKSDKIGLIRIFQYKLFTRKLCLHSVRKYRFKGPEGLHATERQEG